MAIHLSLNTIIIFCNLINAAINAAAILLSIYIKLLLSKLTCLFSNIDLCLLFEAYSVSNISGFIVKMVF